MSAAGRVTPSAVDPGRRNERDSDAFQRGLGSSDARVVTPRGNSSIVVLVSPALRPAPSRATVARAKRCALRRATGERVVRRDSDRRPPFARPSFRARSISRPLLAPGNKRRCGIRGPVRHGRDLRRATLAGRLLLSCRARCRRSLSRTGTRAGRRPLARRERRAAPLSRSGQR